MRRHADTLNHAAELLEAEAKSLCECHTIDGDWTGHADAKADYDDMTRTAHRLRAIAIELTHNKE